ncbi:MAG: hypothetical protein AABY22_27090 [Nanoarchaeota archaeon]
MSDFIDPEKLTYDFFCNLKTGDEIGFYTSDKKLQVFSYKPKKSFTLAIEHTVNNITTTHKIRIIFAYGNWYTGLNCKGGSKGQSLFSNIWRDIEGEIILNLLNANNPFHESTQIFKIATNLTT